MASAHFQDVYIEAQALALNHRAQDGAQYGGRLSKTGNRRRKSEEEGGQELVTAQGMPPPPYASLPGPIACWSVTLLFLVLHIQELEDEGLLLAQPVALATLGRMQVVSLVTPGKPACRDREKWTGQQSGWVVQAEPGQEAETPGL